MEEYATSGNDGFKEINILKSVKVKELELDESTSLF